MLWPGDPQSKILMVPAFRGGGKSVLAFTPTTLLILKHPSLGTTGVENCGVWPMAKRELRMTPASELA